MKIEKGKVIFESQEDLLPIAISQTGTNWNRTGSWKYMEPFYQDLTPPCVHSCYVGNDIVTFMRLIDEGRYDEASVVLLRHNPFPATLGRVCPHPCETPCNRKELGGSIRIQSAERFLGDYAIAQGILPEVPEISGPEVTIVGAGPSGLTAAFFLRKLGYAPRVIEASDRIGGLLWSGIPPFRLPRKVLEKELDRLIAIGIKFQFGQRVGKDISLDQLLTQSPAVLLAVGLNQTRPLGVPGEDHPHAIDGLALLRRLHEGKKVDLGHRIAVIGGGNTAMDCARSLLRLSHDVTVLYRRTKAEMPAFHEEIQESEEEGIRIEFLTAPQRILTKGKRIVGIECIRMKLGEPDESCRPRPVPIEGSQFILPVDGVVKALGETMDTSLVPDELRVRGYVNTNNFQTLLPGLFACGDCLGDGGTVGQALAAGRAAAHAVHAFLSGAEYCPPDPLKRRNASAEVAQYDQFSTEYFSRKAAPALRIRQPEERLIGFSEVNPGLMESEIRAEAARCFKCGTCNLCDNCRFFCPDNAIILKPDGSGYQILYEYCKGCLVCVEECPRGAIHHRRVEV